MKVKFTIPGEPVGKGRPRFTMHGGHVVTYTPEKTVEYEALVRRMYKREANGVHFADNAEIEADIIAYFGIPKREKKARREAMMRGEIKPTKKPDADNLCKVIMDALNDVAYHDDAQITTLMCEKLYSDTPRVVVALSTIDKEDT